MYLRIRTALLCLVLCLGVASAPGQDLSVADATALSKETGRPILALAGSSDCPACRALLERLTTDASIQPLVGQFVPLKIDTSTDTWQEWERLYRSEGATIPKLYVVRADGTLLFGKSGFPQGPELPAFLSAQLQQSGAILSAEELEKLQAALAAAQTALEAGDPATAVTRSVKFAGSGCLAASAVELDGLVKKLAEQGQAALAAAQAALGSAEAFAGLVALQQVKLTYGALPDLKAPVNQALAEAKRNAAWRDWQRPAELLARYALSVQRGEREEAEAGYERLVGANDGSPAAAYAQAQLAVLRGEAPPATPVAAATPPGDSVAGEPVGQAGQTPPANAEEFAARRAELLFQVAQAYAAAGRNAEARRYADQAVVAAPLSPTAKAALEFVQTLPKSP